MDRYHFGVNEHDFFVLNLPHLCAPYFVVHTVDARPEKQNLYEFNDINSILNHRLLSGFPSSTKKEIGEGCHNLVTGQNWVHEFFGKSQVWIRTTPILSVDERVHIRMPKWLLYWQDGGVTGRIPCLTLELMRQVGVKLGSLWERERNFSVNANSDFVSELAKLIMEECKIDPRLRFYKEAHCNALIRQKLSV